MKATVEAVVSWPASMKIFIWAMTEYVKVLSRVRMSWGGGACFREAALQGEHVDCFWLGGVEFVCG